MSCGMRASTWSMLERVSLVDCLASQRVLVLLVPVGAVVTQRLVGCSDVLQSVSSSIADVLHQRIVMIVVLHVIVTCDQIGDHGLHHVDVWTSVGWHAGTATLGLCAGVFTTFAAGAAFLLFDWHVFVWSCVEVCCVVQMSQIDHLPVRLLKLNASFK